MKQILIALTFAALAFVVSLPTARANGEAGPNPIYFVHVTANTVEVCPQGPTHRFCPDPSGMLRQDASSGQVVRLADYCYAGCYIDECVPKGTYLYGLASPYECCTECPRTDYYGVAEVTTDLPAECTRNQNNSAPESTTTPVPWPTYDPEAGEPANVCAQAAPTGTSDNGDGGCSIHGRTRVAVVGVQLLAAAIGAWMIARRRRAR